MQYLILHHQEPIGTIREPKADVSMGMVFGSFAPLPAYEQVRPVFRLFTEGALTGSRNEDQLRDYYQKRDALHLTITTLQNIPVKTLWIHIYDLADDAYQAEFNVDYADGSFFVNASLWDQ
jgi:hypothetical protein